MEGPMDKFVKKRKTDEEEPSEKQTKIANKSPLKEKKAPISLEKKKQKKTQILNFIHHMNLL